MLVHSTLDWNLAFQWRSVLKHMTYIPCIDMNRPCLGLGSAIRFEFLHMHALLEMQLAWDWNRPSQPYEGRDGFHQDKSQSLISGYNAVSNGSDWGLPVKPKRGRVNHGHSAPLSYGFGITLHYFEPAVNRQPGFRWCDS